MTRAIFGWVSRKRAIASGGAALPLDAQFQRLQPFQQQPGVERAQRRPGVAVEQPEIVLDVFLAGQDRAAERAALPVDMLGRRIDDDIGAERQRLLQQRCRKDIVHDQDAAGAMRQPRHLGEIDDLHRRVRRAFAERHRRAWRQRLFPGREVAPVDDDGLDPVARQQFGDDVIARAEQRAAGDDPLAGAHLAQQGREHRRHAAGRRAAGLRPLDQPQPLLEHRHGRVAVARIDVARAVLLERGLGLGGGAVDKPRGQEQRLRGFLIGAALAAAAHQQRRGGKLGGQFGRQDRLRHRGPPRVRRPATAGAMRNAKSPGAAGQGL